MESRTRRILVGVSLSTLSGALDHMKLNPCRLLCHMEHSIDRCKLVNSEDDRCSNLFWLGSERSSTIVDTIPEPDYIPIHPTDAIFILKVNKHGCDDACAAHDDCIDSGSECKASGVCLNLFWNPGSPVRSEMTTCYQRSEAGCNDGTPILCGNEPAPRRHDAEAGPPASPSTDENSRIREKLEDDETEGSTGTKQPLASQSNDAISVATLIPNTGLLVIPFFTRW